MPLCSYCAALPNKLFSFRRQDQSDHDHQPSYPALEASAATCPGCRLLVHAVEANSSEHAGKYALRSAWKGSERIHLSSTKFGWQVVRIGWVEVGHVRGFAVPEGWSNEPPPGPDATPQAHLTHEANLIAHWSQLCLDNHTCCASQDSQFLPTRLIDIGTCPDSTVRLVLGADVTPQAKYMVLSHCWGLSMPNSGKTTSSTLPDHLVSLSPSSLPLTFQDFIDIARRLHTRYIWIDSLCIIQDSRADWEREAAQMASVYSNALLTVAASGSPDGNSGCRTLQSMRSHGPVDLDCNVTTEPAVTKQQRFRLWSRDPYPLGQVLQRDPLVSRGWTLQERELSPRIVHYSRDSIRWECGARRASLEFPWEDPFSFDAGRLFDGGSSDRPTLIGPPRLDSQPMNALTKRRICWFELVHKYTSRKLTRQSDILPAVSGIARSIAAQTGDEYHAGLWMSYFAHCLLWASDWHMSRGLKQHSRPQNTYLAPSWSWASVKGPIHYLSWVNGYWHSFNEEPDPAYAPSIIDVSLQASSDPYGMLTGGTLTMEAKMAVAFSRQDEYAQPKDHLAVTFTAGPQDRLYLHGLSAAGKMEKIGEIRYDVPLCTDCSPVGSVKLVWLACCMNSQRSDDGKMRTCALALQESTADDTQQGAVPAGQLGQFRRVGIAWGIDSSFWEKSVRKRIVII